MTDSSKSLMKFVKDKRQGFKTNLQNGGVATHEEQNELLNYVVYNQSRNNSIDESMYSAGFSSKTALLSGVPGFSHTAHH